jgi:hypothetical protein
MGTVTASTRIAAWRMSASTSSMNAAGITQSIATSPMASPPAACAASCQNALRSAMAVKESTPSPLARMPVANLLDNLIHRTIGNTVGPLRRRPAEHPRREPQQAAIGLLWPPDSADGSPPLPKSRR